MSIPAIKITSEAEPFTVQVTDPATGANLSKYITNIQINLRPGEPPTATMEVLVDVDVMLNGDDITWERVCFTPVEDNA